MFKIHIRHWFSEGGLEINPATFDDPLYPDKILHSLEKINF